MSAICWVLGTPDKFSTILYKGDNFCDFLFAFLQPKSILKGVHSKRKKIASKGSKFFPCFQGEKILSF